MSLQPFLSDLIRGGTFDADRTRAMFELILTGTAEDVQIASVLSIIATRGVTQAELLGAARAMQAHAVTIPTDGLTGVVIDTCGTGGAAKTFNVSTIAAFVIAAAAPGRVHVAKHGNKSRTGRGSAEVLSELGVNISSSVNQQSKALRLCGVCFCFAQAHHPAAKYAAKSRISLGFPTIFNLLGPLCNPARASRQVMGVYDPRYLTMMANVLQCLGTQRAVVLHGSSDGSVPTYGGGIDELSTLGPTLTAYVESGSCGERVLDVRGIVPAATNITQLRADNITQAAEIAKKVLRGESGPHRDFVVANAALGLVVAGCATTLEQGTTLSHIAIDSGAALGVLNDLIQISND